MKSLIERIKNLVRWQLILLFIFVTLFFSLVLFPAFTKEVKEITGVAIKSVDALLFPGVKTVVNTINSFRQNNVAGAYIRTEIQKDLAFPFIYTILLCLLLAAVYLKWRVATKME